MNGKVALITGGTGGIGRAAAIEFAKRGVNVVVTGRREEAGQETAKLIEDAGAKGLFVRADVAKEADCANMVKGAVAKFGRLDYAFNNAGVEGHMGPVVEQSEENYRHVMDINVLGVLLSMKYQIPEMLKAGGGAIVNNSSVAGVVAMPGISVYAASKHAVIGLTKAAALEVAPQKIRVNAVSPGAVKTDMYSRFTGDDKATQEQLAAMHPVGRAGNASEIASLVVFLCSPEAAFMTGANYLADGGWVAQ